MFPTGKTLVASRTTAKHLLQISRRRKNVRDKCKNAADQPEGWKAVKVDNFLSLLRHEHAKAMAKTVE